jgi:NAD(P)-dependent dehydrogenase (short-subunit alcohol dehydrogenase family)
VFFRVRQLAGKRALVVGASSGIGKAIALALAQRGAQVGILGRNRAALEQVAEDIKSSKGSALVIVADATVDDDRKRAIDEFTTRFGGMDILVNCAGVGAFGHFIDMTPEILRRVFEVNFFALAEMCRRAIPRLAEGNQPIIVNVGSMTGRRAVPAWTEYSASKYAVSGFSEALRAEMARFDIDVCLVIPGVSRSNLGRNLLADKGKMPAGFDNGLPVERVAARVVRAIECNWNEVRIEAKARWFLILNRLCPRIVDFILARVVRRLYADEIKARRLTKATSAPSARSPSSYSTTSS